MALYANGIGSPEEIYNLLDVAFIKNPENFTNPNALYIYFDLFYKQYKEGKKAIQTEAVFVKWVVRIKITKRTSSMRIYLDKLFLSCHLYDRIHMS